MLWPSLYWRRAFARSNILPRFHRCSTKTEMVFIQSGESVQPARCRCSIWCGIFIPPAHTLLFPLFSVIIWSDRPVWSFWSYCTADRDKLITKGIYRYSRNPMYVVFTIGFLGIAISCASLWLLLVLLPYVWAMHGTILGEEQYCEKTFGDDYREYKKRVPRYIIFK